MADISKQIYKRRVFSPSGHDLLARRFARVFFQYIRHISKDEIVREVLKEKNNVLAVAPLKKERVLELRKICKKFKFRESKNAKKNIIIKKNAFFLVRKCFQKLCICFLELQSSKGRNPNEGASKIGFILPGYKGTNFEGVYITKKRYKSGTVRKCKPIIYNLSILFREKMAQEIFGKVKNQDPIVRKFNNVNFDFWNQYLQKSEEQ